MTAASLADMPGLSIPGAMSGAIDEPYLGRPVPNLTWTNRQSHEKTKSSQITIWELF